MMLLHAMNVSATYPGIRMVCIKRAVDYLYYSFSSLVESKERCNYGFESMTNLINWVGVSNELVHDDVIKWKHFPRYGPFVRGIYRSPVNSPHKGQWRGAFMFLFDLRPNKRLSKQSWGWWFETPSRPLWRQCNVFRDLMAINNK